MTQTILPPIPAEGLPGLPPICRPEDVVLTPEQLAETKEQAHWLCHPFGSRLWDLRITPGKELPQRAFLFRMMGKPCFPQGELVAVTGKAKSGKTFFCSALMVAALRGECLGIKRTQEDAPYPQPLVPERARGEEQGKGWRVLWIDTEQSEDSTQDILVNRIMRMADAAELRVGRAESAGQTPQSGWSNAPEALVEESKSQTQRSCWSEGRGGELLTAINLRSESWDRRMDLIEGAMQITAPQLMIFDGVRDVVSDINDGVGAQLAIERLMQLASAHNCCIVCVLHQNKAAEDKSLRGALGTELQNKSFETYECKKEEDRTFTISQTATRKYDIADKLRFMVTADGLPEALAPAASAAQESAPAPFKPLCSRYLDENRHFLISDIFRDAFEGEEALKFRELERKVRALTGIESYTTYNQLLANAIRSGVLCCQQTDNGKIYRPGSC